MTHVLEYSAEVWPRVLHQDVLLTGGTGFFGKWLVESWSAAKAAMGGRGRLWVLTRDPAAFARVFSETALAEGVKLLQGDVRTFEPPPELKPHYLLHGALSAAAARGSEDPLALLDIAIMGTRRMLEFAKACECRNFLLVSSGAVYGAAAGSKQVDETHGWAPDPLQAGSTYAQGKRQAEHLCALYNHLYGVPFSVARCFAFVGPHLPLDGPFAVGNFIRDAREGGPIRVRDGTAWRSYLYAADLCVWLWHLLVRGAAGRAYNVGSDEPVQIGSLARQIAIFYGCGAEIGTRESSDQASYYVPSVKRARSELGLEIRVQLPEALARTERFLSGVVGA